jgi:hypothetical protein
LDGYNQMDLLTGKGPSARHEVFYFGESQLGAIRIDDFKFQFYQQPGNPPAVKNAIAFRITDQQDQPGHGKGHQSRAYLIVPGGGVVTVTCGDGFDVTGQPKQPKNVSEEIGIQCREDVTIENVKKLIMRAIEEYRNDHCDPSGADNNNHLK